MLLLGIVYDKELKGTQLIKLNIPKQDLIKQFFFISLFISSVSSKIYCFYIV